MNVSEVEYDGVKYLFIHEDLLGSIWITASPFNVESASNAFENWRREECHFPRDESHKNRSTE